MITIKAKVENGNIITNEKLPEELNNQNIYVTIRDEADEEYIENAKMFNKNILLVHEMVE